MGTRYSRRTADGTFEHSDDKNVLYESARREASEGRAGLFGFLGLLIGGVLTYVTIVKYGADWPKWLRFGTLLLGAGTACVVAYKLADWIWNAILLILTLLVIYGIATWIWKAV